jgi:hypothetical protein
MRFWNNIHRVLSKSKDWKVKSQRKPKGLNRIVKIGYIHLFLREEYLCFNNYITYGLIISAKRHLQLGYDTNIASGQNRIVICMGDSHEYFHEWTVLSLFG